VTARIEITDQMIDAGCDAAGWSRETRRVIFGPDVPSGNYNRDVIAKIYRAMAALDPHRGIRIRREERAPFTITDE
jgi:hypothetical protein